MYNILKKVTEFFRGTAIVFLLTLFSSVFIQIIMRNIFRTGSIKLEELARFSLVSLVFLMIPVLTFEGKHIIVDIVLVYLKGKVRTALDGIIQLVCGAFGVFILFAIATIMERNWSVRTPAIGMPNLVFYLPITLGMLFMVVGSLYNAVVIFTKKGETL
ncbi:MAG TPA: TRAP transporter small permease subunit [Sphaerochaeta sp.]|nr:TRAP transporter small permease subunit [Sphaerochaeta sp.]